MINRTYDHQEVYNATLKYFNGDDLATNAWMSKYALKEGNNFLELTPDDMHKRMAKEFARIENNYPNPQFTEQEIYELFKGFKYIIPQGRVMAGLGVKNSYRSLSNCLVLPSPLDSYSSIMYTDTMLVNAAKRGCGYGLDLSNLRPAGSPTKNAANTSTGIIPFMERFSNSTREVGQAGRRGACLLGLDISHPQSRDFLNAKKDRSKVTGANISLKLTDDFMNAVSKNSTYNLTFDNEVYEIINAKELWLEIIKNARDNAEPGIFFWDRMFEYDPVSVYKKHQIVLTNACGEQSMSEMDSCRLITINLYSIIDNPFTPQAKLNEKMLYELAYKQLRLGDNLIDLEIESLDRIVEKIKSDPEPIEQKAIELKLWTDVKQKAIDGRRSGCGLTGLGDMLAALGIKYGSEKAVFTIQKVMQVKLRAELNATVDLAIERGSFPDFNCKLEYKNNIPQNSFYTMLQDEFPDEIIRMQKYGRRNINWSTVAPVGTVSLLTQTTSGCEPCFKTNYTRRRKVEAGSQDIKFIDQNGDSWEEYQILHPKYKTWLETKNKIENPYKNATANDIDWLGRIKTQAILQRYTTSAISSTINLPEDVSVEVVEKLYFEAWKHGLKGITIYREGSRTGILIENKQQIQTVPKNNAPKRPKELPCKIFNTSIQGEYWIVLIGFLGNDPYEVFAYPNGRVSYKEGFIVKRGRGNYDLKINDKIVIENIPVLYENDEQVALTRLISTSLRHGANVKFIIEQLEKSGGTVVSFSKAVSRALKQILGDGETLNLKCSECGEELYMVEGCATCPNGHSKCG